MGGGSQVTRPENPLIANIFAVVSTSIMDAHRHLR